MLQDITLDRFTLVVAVPQQFVFCNNCFISDYKKIFALKEQS